VADERTRSESQVDEQSTDRDTNGNDSYTVVDEPVREGLDNAVENSTVRTRDSE
jgi:hypothetical protein